VNEAIAIFREILFVILQSSSGLLVLDFITGTHSPDPLIFSW